MKTDAEIMRALELCTKDECAPDNACPYAKNCEECESLQELKNDAIALIGRVKAEISLSKEEIARLEEENMCLKIQMRGDCGVCKHREVGFGYEPCDSCIEKPDRPAWEYEGLPELRRENKR